MRWASTCCRCPSAAGPARRAQLPANTQVDRSRTDHGRVRRQCARALGVQARAALAAGAPGRIGHRDVRVPQRAEPHAWRRRRSRATRRCRRRRTSTSWSASASTSTRWSRARAKQWPVVFVIDPKLPEGRDDDHPVVHLLRGRRQGAARADRQAGARRAPTLEVTRDRDAAGGRRPVTARKGRCAAPCSRWCGRSSACAGAPTTRRTSRSSIRFMWSSPASSARPCSCSCWCCWCAG